MAEYVEQALQDMVPELDDLRRKRIFNDDEIRIIVKRRRDFEYQLQKTQPRQQDFLGYVKYEIALDCLRRKRSRERKYKRRTLSDLAGIRRCHGILNSACRKFKGDKRMWYQHLDFCLRSGSTKVMSAVVTKALRLHPREVHFWLLAADRELKLGHITSARTLLVRGLRFAPKAAKLWGEFLRLEVRVALHVRLTKSLGNDKTVEEPKEEEAAEGSDAPSQPKSRWGAARLIVRKALGSLSLSPSATASFLRQAVECLREAEAAPPEEDGMKEWVDDVTAALAEKRPGIAEGQEWAEASEEASISLWQLWWDRTVEVGGTWGTVAQAAASSAPGAVLPCLATALAEAARVGAGAKQPGGGSAAAAAALAHLAEAPDRRRPPPQLPRRRWHSWRLWRGARKRTRRRPPPTRPLPRRLPRSCCRPPPPRIRRVGGCTCLPLQHRTTAKRRAALRLRRSRVLRGGARPTTPQASCCWEASPRRALLQDPPRSAEDSWRRCCAT